jgi:hypothetical protein
MGTHASFQQILEEKIQGRSPESRAGSTFDQSTQVQEPAHLAYLMGHLGPSFFRPAMTKIYPTRPKPPPPPHTLSMEQVAARDFFVLRGVELTPAFSQRELKKAFRTLALKLHPDMNKGASGAFIELKNNYETLDGLFIREAS